MHSTISDMKITTANDLQKFNILAITWVLVICLKYMHLHSGLCAHVYISDKLLMPGYI